MNYDLTFLLFVTLALFAACATAPRSDGISNSEAQGIIALDREFRQ